MEHLADSFTTEEDKEYVRWAFELRKQRVCLEISLIKTEIELVKLDLSEMMKMDFNI